MKKIIVSLSFILGLTIPIFAEESTNSSWTPSVTFRSVVANKYLAFGSGAVLYDKSVVQSDLFLSFRNGLYLDLWNSTPFTGHDNNFGWEQDIGIGWAGPLSTFGLKGPISDIVLDIGCTYFDEPSLFTIGARDVVYNHMKVSKAFKFVTVAGWYENYIAARGSPYRGGNLFSLGVEKGQSFFNDRLRASTSFALTYDDGGFACGDGLLFRGRVELDWVITKHLTLILPQINYYAPLTVCRSLDAVFFGGFSYTF